MILKCPKSAEIIHPVLRGKDIKKYSIVFSNLWLINTHNGLREINLPRVNVKTDYPSIFEHLKKYEGKLIDREDKGDDWTNLRSCAYLNEFKKPKIVYPEITKYLPFVYDDNGYYMNNKTFFITGGNLKYLVAFLNSSIFKSCIKSNFPDLGEDRRELRKTFFEPTMILYPDASMENEISKMVDLIIFQKSRYEPTEKIEEEIDSILYKAYNLTDDEVRLAKKLAFI